MDMYSFRHTFIRKYLYVFTHLNIYTYLPCSQVPSPAKDKKGTKSRPMTAKEVEVSDILIHVYICIHIVYLSYACVCHLQT
jgi:hypothetical protein